MNTYISILRGINVSGHKLIKMDALKNIFQKLGLQDVQTYIQSGNVVFRSAEKDNGKLEKAIAKKITETFDFDVPVLVLPLKKLEQVFSSNPFLKGRNEDITKLHVTFLSEVPLQENIDLLKAGSYGTDEFTVVNDVVYLFCPDGYGNTKLSNTFFESKLKVSATTRNWKTITELVKIAGNIKVV